MNANHESWFKVFRERAKALDKHIVLPDQNRNDWTEVPEEVRKKLTVHFVQHISQLLPLTLRVK